MKQSHFGDFPFSPGYEEALSTAAVFKRVSEETSAIGFASFDGFQGKPMPELKVLAIGETEGGYYSNASQEDVLTRKYPYTRDIYIYINRAPGKPLNPFVKEYLRMVLSKEGQQAFHCAGCRLPAARRPRSGDGARQAAITKPRRRLNGNSRLIQPGFQEIPARCFPHAKNKKTIRPMKLLRLIATALALSFAAARLAAEDPRPKRWPRGKKPSANPILAQKS